MCLFGFFLNQHFGNLCFLTFNLENGSVTPLIEGISLCLYFLSSACAHGYIVRCACYSWREILQCIKTRSSEITYNAFHNL